MVESRDILLLPFDHVQRARREHGLRYTNPRGYPYDYTLADTMAIPMLIVRWCDEGLIDLSMSAVESFHETNCEKRTGGRAGEINRVQKLFLDALAELYQACAFRDFANVAAKYNGAYDSRGVDLRLKIESEWLPVNVQRVVNATIDHVSVKSKRRASRGCEPETIWILSAYKNHLDMSHQPWVPAQDWYGLQVESLRNMSKEVHVGR